MRRSSSPVRKVGLTALLVALVFVSPATAIAGDCWSPPVQGRLVDRFRAPACPWCPGNRGLEYEVSEPSPVVAVETGTVSFGGTVAGTRYVVVRAANGRLVTYGRLLSAHVRRDDPVVRGATIGWASGPFYFGVREDGRYVDPAPMLGELVARRRLIPLDGRRPRPAPSPTLRCPASEAPR